MAINKYCNLYGENKIKDDYTKINDGFASVETDVSGVLNSELERETAETQREINEIARKLRYSNTKHYSEYNNDFVYHTNNIVSYQGSSFMLKENIDGTILESQGYAPPEYPVEENERWKMVGKRGDKGNTGVVPDIQVGTVTTLQPGSSVTVTRQAGSSDEAPVFNFGIPRGADGTGVGDVLWADIDQDHDGIIDNANNANTAADANKLGGQLPSYYAKETEFESLSDAFNTHQSDYTNHVPPLGITSNVDNSYSITSSKIITDGSKFSVKFNAAATGTATLNILSDGTPRRLIKPGGTDFKPKAGTYLFIRDGENFQCLGEGGEYGTDNPNDVRAGVPFGTEDGIKIGTNMNNLKSVVGTIPDFFSPVTYSSLTLTGTINNLPFRPKIVIFTFKDSYYSFIQQTVSSAYTDMLPSGIDFIRSGTAYFPLGLTSNSDFLSNGFKYYSQGTGTQYLGFSQVKYLAIGLGD